MPLIYVVVRLVPFFCMTELETNPVPVTVKVRCDVSPSVSEVMLVMAGTGLFTCWVSEGELLTEL